MKSGSDVINIAHINRSSVFYHALMKLLWKRQFISKLSSECVSSSYQRHWKRTCSLILKFMIAEYFQTSWTLESQRNGCDTDVLSASTVSPRKVTLSAFDQPIGQQKITKKPQHMSEIVPVLMHTFLAPPYMFKFKLFGRRADLKLGTRSFKPCSPL